MPEILTPDILKEPEKILLYGAPKTGKTHLAGTAPGDLYFLVIGPRNELKTLAAPAFRRQHPDKVVHYDFALEELGERGQFKQADAFNIACDLLDEALEMRRKGDIQFDSVIVENATTLTEVQMNMAIEINYSTGNVGNADKKALAKLRDFNILQPADNDWGSAQSLMNQMVNWLFKLDVNVVMIAHEWIVETQDRKTKNKIVHAILPSFIGKLRTDIPRSFDNVWRTTVEGGGRGIRHALTTIGTEGGNSAPTVVAGSRVGGVLPEKMYDADLAEIIEKFHAAGDEWKPSRVDYDEKRNRTVVTSR
jgi:hypothetical protein